MLTLACMFAGLNVATADGRPSKPNVVLILADDLGWQDVQCYDIDEPCPYETPHLDRLADQGVKFWQAYSPAPTCAPSRAAILSGKHPARAQKTHVVGGAPPAPHNNRSTLISPWYSGRMPLSDVTIAECLRDNGYATGHTGKWHVAINHKAFPQPEDQGFQYTRSDRGVTSRAKPNRLTGFATNAKDDPYRLDENGFPFHQNTADALDYLDANRSEPFFLYHATWLVHAPIHTRCERLLKKYCRKMQVPFPTDPEHWQVTGQRNPFYGAMVEMLDYYVGRILTYLDETEDPRWPGHRLSENTYVIFSSDNGGMEQHPGEIITDNYPLDKGKINAKEGGVRVPFLVRGPGIAASVESDAMVNGLDFHPTILSWTKTPLPESQLDGSDLSNYLKSDLEDTSLIVDRDGQPRDTMFWHFPHSSMQSTIRVGGFKLIRNWSDVLQNGNTPLELYQLYDSQNQRVDIEESKNLVDSLPEKARMLNQLLEEKLVVNQASRPYLNATHPSGLPNQEKVCSSIKHGRDGDRVWVTFEQNGAEVTRANLIYTENGGERYEEWYRLPGGAHNGRAEFTLPEGTTHYVFNLIDENQFLVSFPAIPAANERTGKYSEYAIAASRDP
ncbi:MAG: sulfatase [Rhodopirellula sp. JB044]|uniref:sulfatase n=1 Tax=Rhodopirellula sp. JB044 TaxID=3342844 RepID=UPI00370B4EA5